MKFILVSILVIFCFNYCLSFNGDEVTQLPGLTRNTTFRQYSGHLDVGKGKFMHYWFVESQSKPESDPLILWLSGGPGCSSITALLEDNGPFRVKSDGKTLVDNPHSWNTFANVLYFESPVGVGFSYDTQNSTTFNDDTTAEDNYSALKRFFEKFPQFSKNSFYIMGSSYAGVYVPNLAHKMMLDNTTINLKGVAVGNGFLDSNILTNSRFQFAYSHGLFDSSVWHNLQQNCCKCGTNGRHVCDFDVKQCKEAKDLNPLNYNFGLDIYNLYRDCPNSEALYLSHFLHIMSKDGTEGTDTPLPAITTNPSCADHKTLVKYMNLPEVRKALHIPEHLPAWDYCSLLIILSYRNQYPSMKAQVKDLVTKYKINKFIVYNGDVDMVCDFMGDQQFVDELGFKLTDKYKKWSVGDRTAGFVKRYEGITFMTVRNAGHTVPLSQPEAGIAIVKELIGVKNVA